MKGETIGAYIFAAIMLFAVGTVAAHSISEYELKEGQVRINAYEEGMAEMHNAMMGTNLSEEEILELHDEWGCWGQEYGGMMGWGMGSQNAGMGS